MYTLIFLNYADIKVVRNDEGDEESQRDEEDSEPEWGYDSFDGREYHSSDQMGYSDKEFDEKCRYYRHQVILTKGFFEPSDRFPPLWGGISSLYDLEADAGKGLTVREFCANLTSSCLNKYNQEVGLNVKLEHILRANYNPGSMSKFYITFAARESDSPDAPLEEYQAKAAWSAADKTYPILCHNHHR
ncbi:unnamed protein product [Arabidopsis thaliana]|uniref:Cystatin/monellin superfamily protein n=1 Tax=Arabidopsis thaliana TaxID=3702 RepID=A0A654F4C4_ARATH|nr:unnamed protein product [Arabidopsis thaliana]